MCWTYILRNKATNKYYFGSTTDLERRLKQHLSGNTRTTKILNAKELIYKEYYTNGLDARLREKQLKLYKNKAYIDKLILSS